MGNALQTLFIAQLHVADQMFCEMLRQLTDNIATLQSAQLKHFVSTTGSNSYGTEINSEKASHLPAVKIEYTFLYIRKNFLYRQRHFRRPNATRCKNAVRRTTM